MDVPAGLPDLCQLSQECSGPVEGEQMAKNGVICCTGQSGRPVFPNLKSKVSAAHFTSHKLTRIMITQRLPPQNRPDARHHRIGEGFDWIDFNIADLL